MVQKIHMKPAGAVVEDIAVLLSPPAEYCERVAIGKRDVADEEVRLGPRRFQEFSLHRRLGPGRLNSVNLSSSYD